ncbi:MAG TPA: BatA domain-containing protein [Blastocatellia bacterium]|nr:BatA domain-containing protein [Blastocatellia bacterium]
MAKAGFCHPVVEFSGAMSFLHPFFLFGALAAGVPILVHLVRRTRANRIKFPSLMFLKGIEQKTVRRRKLRNLVLLLLRCAALLLLALAFSRPYFAGRNARASTEKRATVVLLDVSYSMGYAGVFDRAKVAARDIVSKAHSGTPIAVAAFSSGSEVISPLKPDPARALTAIGAIKPGLGTTDYPQAIQAANALVKDGANVEGAEADVYMISDFQAAGWNRNGPTIKLLPGLHLIPVDVSDRAARNLAVTNVKADPVIYSQKYTDKVVASIANFGSSAAGNQNAATATVELKINELAAERVQVKIEAGATQNLEFSGFNVPEGSNRATLEIDNDGLPVDNMRYFTIQREAQTKVLSIETASRGRGDSFFIHEALAAGSNSPYALTVKTVGGVNPDELSQYRVIILNDVEAISDGLAAAIRTFAERGGGVLLAAGKHTDPGEFNQKLGSISPAKLGDTVQARGGFATMSQVRMDHPVFSLFNQSGRLAPVRVYAYHSSAAKQQSSVIAGLDDGSPLIVDGSAGSGKVLLLDTSLDSTWTDLPVTPIFLPLVRQILDYLSGRASTAPITAGQVFDVPADATGTIPQVNAPDGGRVDRMVKANGQWPVLADQVGFYALRYHDHTSYLAVNVDTKESDLTALNIEELVASLSASSAGAPATASAQHLTRDEIEAKQRTWLPLLVLALVMFVAEALLARRIKVPRVV